MPARHGLPSASLRCTTPHTVSVRKGRHRKTEQEQDCKQAVVKATTGQPSWGQLATFGKNDDNYPHNKKL